MPFKIIDAHIHIGPSRDRMVPEHTVQRLVERMDHYGIEKAISSCRYSMRNRYDAGYEMDAEAYRLSGGRVYCFCNYTPKQSDEAVENLRARRDDPMVRGIKLFPPSSGYRADDEHWRPVWEAANELGMPIMSHTWAASSYNPGQTYATADRFEKWVREYPEVNFVFGHCGGRYHGVKDAIAIGKKYKNAYFDITGDIFMNGFIEELVDGVGADHMVYGSDWTMFDQSQMLGVVLGSDLPTVDKEKILYHTAERLYFGWK